MTIQNENEEKALAWVMEHEVFDRREAPTVVTNYIDKFVAQGIVIEETVPEMTKNRLTKKRYYVV